MKDRWESNINVQFPFMNSQKWNCYFQNRILMFCLPVPTLIYLWEIYIFPGLVCLFCSREICGPILGIYINRSQTHECGKCDWGRAIPRRGVHKWYFPCSEIESLTLICGSFLLPCVSHSLIILPHVVHRSSSPPPPSGPLPPAHQECQSSFTKIKQKSIPHVPIVL